MKPASATHRCRCKRGERAQAIGRSRGGRTTKIHALSDRFCRPIAFLLTGGQVADCTAALLEHTPATVILHGDKGYDGNAVRTKIDELGIDGDVVAVRYNNRRAGAAGFAARSGRSLLRGVSQIVGAIPGARSCRADAP